MKTVLKIIGGIFAFIFCLVILCVELVGHGVFGLNNVAHEKKMSKIIDSTNISYLLEDEDGNKTKFYKEIEKSTKEINLKENEINGLINSTGFKNILKKIAIGMKEEYIYNSQEYALSEEEITDLVNANIDNMIANINRQISPEDREVLLELAKKKITELVENLPSFDEVRNNYPKLKYTNTLLDIKLKLAIIGAVVILTLLISLVTWSFSTGLKCSGIVTAITSFIVIIVGLIISLVLSYILHNIPTFESYVSVLKSALKEVGLVFIFDGLITLGVSVIMLIIASLLAQKAERKEEQGTILAN